MPDLYEIQVVACTPDGNSGNLIRLEHRFPSIPDIDTIRALRDEVARYYTDLYEEKPEVTQVVAMRLTAHDVAIQEKVTPVEWDWTKP